MVLSIRDKLFITFTRGRYTGRVTRVSWPRPHQAVDCQEVRVGERVRRACVQRISLASERPSARAGNTASTASTLKTNFRDFIWKT